MIETKSQFRARMDELESILINNKNLWTDPFGVSYQTVVTFLDLSDYFSLTEECRMRLTARITEMEELIYGRRALVSAKDYSVRLNINRVAVDKPVTIQLLPHLASSSVRVPTVG